MHGICVSTTLNDDISFDFNIFLKTYSEIIYDVFIWHLVFYAKGKDENFTITEFSDIIKFPKEINPNNDGILSLEQLHKRCVEKYHELVKKYPNHISDVEILKKMLQNYGLLSTTSYFFIQGHTLCDNVVLMILKPICKKLRGNKIDEIKNQSKTSQDLKEKLSHYEKRTNKVEDVLSLNTNYKNCFLYKKTTQDIEVFLQNKK